MEKVNQIVTQLFVATDQQNWKTVASCFADKIHLDYSSMSGNPATIVTPKEIITAWKSILPGFTSTHHQLGNFILTVKDSTAYVFCYGTATHYLEDQEGSVWTVVGSYDFDLTVEGTHWKISSMTFNFKYQDGNTSLAQKAMEHLNDKK